MLCAILLKVGWWDFCYRKVPNFWIAIGAMVGILWKGVDFLPPAGVVLVVSFFAYYFRLIGAGDGKCMAMIAGYLGMRDGMYAISIGMFVGGIWSLYLLGHKQNLRIRLYHRFAGLWRNFLTKQVVVYENPLEDGKKHTVPLATCLAVGTYLVLLYFYGF